ncbi:MAG: lactate utilization protein [Candidatus Cloacimonetes bacterium]|nr:lactate utilization protein [Candidatus Cloacimonadota bacterium]
MTEYVEWYNDLQISKAKQALEKNGFLVEVFSSGEQARDEFLARIDKKKSIGIGGSTTIKEIGLFQHLLNNDYNIINPYVPDLTREEIFTIRRKTLMADYLITSSNAVTLQGELVNVDGYSNRVAGIMFGPKKVYLFIGKNKIVYDMEAGIDRVFNYAAPINAKRLHKNTPCVETGVCEDCNSEDRICNNLTVTMKQSIKDRINIFLINEDLGF